MTTRLFPLLSFLLFSILLSANKDHSDLSNQIVYQDADCNLEQILLSQNLTTSFMPNCNSTSGFALANVSYTDFNECGTPSKVTYSANIPHLTEVKMSFATPGDFNFKGNVTGGTLDNTDANNPEITPTITGTGENSKISVTFDLQAACSAPDSRVIDFMFTYIDTSGATNDTLFCNTVSQPLVVQDIALSIAAPGTPGRNTEPFVTGVLNEVNSLTITLVQEAAGFIDSFFFYVEDHALLDIDKVQVCSTGQVLPVHTTIGNRSYYLIDNSIVGTDGFIRNEGLDLCVFWLNNVCPSEDVDPVIHGVISSCPLDPSDVCESSEFSAAIDFDAKLPQIRHLIDTASANFDPICYEDGSTEQAWFFINTGEAPAGDVTIRIDDNGGVVMMDLTSLTIQVGSDLPFTPSLGAITPKDKGGIPSCARTGNPNHYSDFSYTLTDVDLPVGDTIKVRYSIKSPDCDCGTNDCASPKRFATEVEDVEVRTLCDRRVQSSRISYNGNLDRWPGFLVSISTFMESTLTICEGGTSTLKTNLSNYINSYLKNDGSNVDSDNVERDAIYHSNNACEDCYLEVKYTIPNGLDWAGSTASDIIWRDNDGTVWHPNSVSYTDNDGGDDILTIIWQGQETPDFDAFSEYSTMELDYTIDCTNELTKPDGCGWNIYDLEIKKDIKFSTGNCTNCAGGEVIQCTENLPIVAKCFGTGTSCSCEGFVQTLGEGERSNLKEPDQDNDGCANGDYNMDFLRRDRFIKGDSIAVKMGGYVQTNGTTTYDYMYAEIEMPDPNFIPIGGEVTIYENGGAIHTCNILTQTLEPGDILVTDISVGRLMANGCSAPVTYEDGDSISITVFFKSTNEFIGEVDNKVYRTRIFASDEPYGGVKRSCRLPLDFRLTQIGTQSTFNINQKDFNGFEGCDRAGIRYEGYSRLGAANVDYFPGEYIREIDVPSLLTATIPEGMVFDYFRATIRKKNASSSISQGSVIAEVPSKNITAAHPAVTLVGDQIIVNMVTYVETEFGGYPCSDEGYSYSLEFWYLPTCNLDIGPLEDVTVMVEHTTDSEIFCATSYSIEEDQGSLRYDGGAEIKVDILTDSINIEGAPTCALIRVSNTGSSKSNNTWVSFSDPSGQIIFQSFSEVTSSDTIEISGGSFNIFPVGDLNGGKSKTFLLCVYANVCEIKELKVLAGYDCVDYPNTLEEAVCFDEDSIYFLPVTPSLSMKSKTPDKDLFFDDLCDTATYIVDINAAGPGFLSDLLLDINLPLNVDLVQGSFEIAYPTSVDANTTPPDSEFEPISDPSLLYGNTWRLDVSASDPILDSIGLIGSAGSAFNLNVVNVRYKIVTTCGFASGSRIYYESSAKSGCGEELIPREKDFTPKIGIGDGPPPFVSEINIAVDTLEACRGEESKLIIDYGISGAEPTNSEDSIRVILPPGITYVPGSYVVGTNPHPDPPIAINTNGQEVLYWGIGGLDPNDEAGFSIDIKANDIGQTCGDFLLQVQTFKSGEAYCAATMETCTVRAISDEAAEYVYIDKPILKISAATMTSMSMGDDEMVMMDIEFQNVSAIDMTSGSNVVVDLYGDLDNDGRLTDGVDTLVGTLTYDIALTAGESASYSSVATIPAEFSCAVMAVLDIRKNCVCNSTTSARIRSNLTLKFDKDLEVCSGSSTLIGPEYNESYDYLWTALNGAPMDALDVTDSTPVTFTYVNTLPQPIEFKYGLIAIRGPGCYAFDTVTITVFEDQSKSLASMVCGPVMNCGGGGVTGFNLTGPVGGTNYMWNITNGDLTATIDDDIDPLTSVSSGISQTTEFTLNYIDNNGCPATFVQTVSTMNCACTELGDTVWYDLNLDGLQDPNEPGIPGVTVYLYDANDLNTPLQITLTDANGHYLFSPLPQGNYVVRFDKSTQTGPYHMLIPTIQNAAGMDSLDSDADSLTGYTGPYFISNGISNYTVDAGFYPAFDLALTKELDPSYPQGPYFAGDTAHYIIKVINQGGFYGASDVEVTDYGNADLTLASVGDGVVSSSLGVSTAITNSGGGVFTIDTLAPLDTIMVSIAYRINPAFGGNSLINYAEISDFENEYDIPDVDSDADSTPNNDAGGNPNTATDNSVDGDGSGTYLGTDPDKDEDDHDPASISLEKVDLALQKRIDASFNAPPIVIGEYVKFDITVINQGTLTVDSILVKDYVPAGYNFDHAYVLNVAEGWNSDTTAMIRVTLDPSERATISIYLQAKRSSTPSDYYNYSEIISAYDTIQGKDIASYDIDSEPGSNSVHENAVTPGSSGDNNISSTGINEVGSEDDHDVEGVEVAYVDMALTKIIDPSYDLSNLNYGDSVKYRINVVNQGTLNADTLVIHDYLPKGLKFDASISGNSNWTALNDSTITTTFRGLTAGNSRILCYYLRFQKSDNAEDWINHAEVSRFVDDKGIDRSDEDIDSELNDDPTDNGGGAVGENSDNELDGDGSGMPGDTTSTTDQDNADPAELRYVDLAQIKQITTPGPYKYGDTLTYKITVVNQGNTPATNIVITDSLPAGLKYNASLNTPQWTGSQPVVQHTITDTLQFLDTATVEISLILSQTNGGNEDYTNTTEITRSEDDEGNDTTDDDVDDDDGEEDDNQNEEDDSYEDGDDDRDEEKIEIFDLALKKTTIEMSPFSYGDTITFDFTVFNQGNVASKNILVTDYIPCGYKFLTTQSISWTLTGNMAQHTIPDTLQPGDSIIVSIDLILQYCATSGGWKNIGEISASEDEDGNDTTDDDVDSVADTDGTNDGRMDDNMVDGTNADEDDSDYDSSYDEDDSDPEEVSVFDLALIKEVVTPGPYNYGDTLTYRIKVVNQGNVPATNIIVADSLPIGLGYEASLNTPTWSGSHPVVTHLITDTLQMNDTTSIFINLILNETSGAENAYLNISEITNSEDDKGNDTTDDDVDDDDGDPDDDQNEEDDSYDDGDDDRDTESIVVYDVALRKTAITEGPYKYGDTVEFRIALFNQGSSNVKNLEVVEYIPCGLKYISGLNNPLDWVENSTKKATKIDTSLIRPGDSSAVSIFLEVQKCDTINAYVNAAEIGSLQDENGNDVTDDEIDSDADDNPDNDGEVTDNEVENENEDEDDHDIELIPIYDLALAKLLDNSSLDANGFVKDTVKFNVIVRNQGNVPVSNVEVADYIPCGTKYLPTLNDPLGWSLTADTSYRTITDTIYPDSFKMISIFMEVLMDAELLTACAGISDAPFTNFAEINSFENEEGEDRSGWDVDSEPGSNTDEEREVKPLSDGDNELLSDGSDGNQDDHDPAFLMTLDVALKKVLDTDYNDEPYNYGDTVKAYIELTNQGNICIDTINVIDYLPAGMKFINGMNVGWVYNASNHTATTSYNNDLCFAEKDSLEIFVQLEYSPDVDAYTNYAEISGIVDTSGTFRARDQDSRFDTDDSNDTGGQPFTDDDDNIDGDGTNMGEDEDDHDPLKLRIVDLALKKEFVDEMKPIAPGEEVKFLITIYNQGNITAGSIDIVDYLPEGLVLSVNDTSGWVMVNDSTLSLSYSEDILPGDSAQICLINKIKLGAQLDQLINYAEITMISDTSGTDIGHLEVDSQPDDDRTNDIGAELDTPTDDMIDDHGEIDEDDHDIARVGYVDLALYKTTDQIVPVRNGDDVLFDIHVVNQGILLPEHVAIVDYIPSGFILSPFDNNGWEVLSGNIVTDTLVGVIPFGDTITTQILLRVTDPVSWRDLINYAEISYVEDQFGNNVGIFDRDSNPDDTLSNDNGGIIYSSYDNETEDDGMLDEDDHDPAAPPLMDLALRKTLTDLGRPVQWGDTLEFNIKIFNQGNATATAIEVVDYIAPGYSYVANNNPLWSQEGPSSATTKIDTLHAGDSSIVSILLEVKENTQASQLINFAEISGFKGLDGNDVQDYDSTPDDNPDNDGLVKDDEVLNGENDQDDHDIATPPIFDLALRKTTESGPVVVRGEVVTFLIEIFNQGTIDATSVEIADLPLEGFEFNATLSSDWKQKGDYYEYIPTLDVAVGEVDSIYIYMNVTRIANSFNLINEAEIIATEDGDGRDMDNFDIDSTPDDDFENDTGGAPGTSTDNVINGIGIIDEDDHDPEILTICNPIACIGNVNVSIDNSCNLQFTPAMILADTTNYRRNQIDLDYFDLNGNPIDSVRINEVIKVKVSIHGCSEITCWSNVLIEDKLPPVIMCKPMDTLNCFEMMMYEGPQTNEECNEVKIDTVFSNYVELCENDSIIGKHTRSYRATDQSGNVSKICTEEIYIKAVSIADIEFPKDTTLSCEVLGDKGLEEIKGINVGHALYTGSGSNLLPVPFVVNETNLSKICNISVTFIDRVILDVACKKQILRTYTARQWTCSGHESKREFPQLITVSDTIPPMVSVGDTVKILGGTGQNCKGEVTLSSLKISDNCSKDIQVILSSGEGVTKHHLGEKLMLSSGTHSVIVQALDECHNSSLDTVIVVVKDETAPSAICLREMVVSVNDQGRALIDAKEMDQGSFDNCGPLVSQCGARMSDLMQFDSLLEKNRNFRIEHVDYLAISLIRGGCGRTFESTSNIIIVKDKNTGNARDTVLNTIDGLGYSLSAVNLDTTKVIQRKDLCTSEVLFCCEDMNSGLQVAYTVTDKSGNKNTCMVNVEVQEKSSPSIHCPPDVTVLCTYPLSANYSVFGKVAFEGKQEKLQISPSEVVSHSKALVDGVAFGRCLDSVRESVNESLNSCAVGTVERTFTVRSMNGRESSCKQRITIISDPSATKPEVTYPRDTTIEGCIDTSAISVVLLGTPRAAEGRCNQIGFAHKDEYINLNNGSGAGCWKVIRRWSVYENCTGKTGLVGTKDQVIIFTNSVAPQIAETMDTMRHNIIGSCDAQPITFKNRATDDCTPATELDWKLEITQVSGGTFSRTVTPSVGADTVATTTLSLGGGTYNLRWIVSDGCGNTDVEDQKAIVTVTSNLSAICLGEVTVVLDENRRATVDASVADIGSTNYSCDENVNVVYSFDSTKVISTRRFDCDDLGSMEIKMFVLALDATGLIIESVPCTVRFMTEAHANASCPSGIPAGLPDGETASILGLVLSRNTAAMSKVQMKLTDNESIINNSTNGIGEYGFENIVMGGQYELKPYKNDDWLNGVSTLDLLMIQKHILGLERFKDAYDLIASDINNDEIISAIDMIALRRLILGVDDEVKSNTSWRFVWAGEDLSSFELGNPLTDKYKIWPLESDMLIDWTGIKIGDVSGNVNLSTYSTSRSNDLSTMTYKVDDQDLNRVSFYFQDIDLLDGLQGEISLKDLMLRGVDKGQIEISGENLKITREGNIKFSIPLIRTQKVDGDLPLFSLLFAQSVDIESIEENIKLNTSRIRPEWYFNKVAHDFELEFEENFSENFIVHQNSPNPWEDETSIGISMPREGQVILKIFNSVGKLVYENYQYLTKGYHSIIVNKFDVPNTGMLYYQIEVEDQLITKKMFKVE